MKTIISEALEYLVEENIPIKDKQDTNWKLQLEDGDSQFNVRINSYKTKSWTTIFSGDLEVEVYDENDNMKWLTADIEIEMSHGSKQTQWEPEEPGVIESYSFSNVELGGESREDLQELLETETETDDFLDILYDAIDSFSELEAELEYYSGSSMSESEWRYEHGYYDESLQDSLAHEDAAAFMKGKSERLSEIGGKVIKEAVTPEEKEINDRVSAILRKSPSKMTKSDRDYLKSVEIDNSDVENARNSWRKALWQTRGQNPIGKLRSNRENPERAELARKRDLADHTTRYERGDESANELMDAVRMDLHGDDKERFYDMMKQYNDAGFVPDQGPRLAPRDKSEKHTFDELEKIWRRNDDRKYIYADRKAQAKDMYEPLAKAKQLSILKKMANYEMPLDRARKDILNRKIGESLDESLDYVYPDDLRIVADEEVQLASSLDEFIENVLYFAEVEYGASDDFKDFMEYGLEDDLVNMWNFAHEEHKDNRYSTLEDDEDAKLLYEDDEVVVFMYKGYKLSVHKDKGDQDYDIDEKIRDEIEELDTTLTEAYYERISYCGAVKRALTEIGLTVKGDVQRIDNDKYSFELSDIPEDIKSKLASAGMKVVTLHPRVIVNVNKLFTSNRMPDVEERHFEPVATPKPTEKKVATATSAPAPVATPAPAASVSAPSANIRPYIPSQDVLDKIRNYKDRGSMVNVGAIKNEDKLYKYYYAAHQLGWDALKRKIRHDANIPYSVGILNDIDKV